MKLLFIFRCFASQCTALKNEMELIKLKPSDAATMTPVHYHGNEK